jgi:hypothetical protein
MEDIFWLLKFLLNNEFQEKESLQRSLKCHLLLLAVKYTICIMCPSFVASFFSIILYYAFITRCFSYIDCADTNISKDTYFVDIVIKEANIFFYRGMNIKINERNCFDFNSMIYLIPLAFASRLGLR